MSRKRVALSLLLVMVGSFLLAGPALALDPLVHCGGKNQPECQTCDLLVLGKNIFDIILFYLVPALAALLFIWAGFLILLGGGIPAQVQEGKNIFKTTVYGLLIIFLAWLIVNTILRTVAGDQNVAENWWKLECQEPDVPDNGGDKDDGVGEKLTISEVSCLATGPNEAVVTWKTNKPATSQVWVNEKTITTLDPEKKENHAVTLEGLRPNSSYAVQARSKDENNEEAKSSLCDFKTLAGDGSGNQLRFVTTSLPDAVINLPYSVKLQATGGSPPYRFSVSTGSLPPGFTLQSDGTLTGTPRRVTAYPYAIQAVAEDSNSSLPARATQSFTLRVLATRPAVAISNVVVSSVTASGATITWKTDRPATSQVKYGLTTTYGFMTPVDNNLVTDHRVVLSRLNANNTYNLKALSSANTFNAESSNYSFRTGSLSTDACTDLPQLAQQHQNAKYPFGRASELSGLLNCIATRLSKDLPNEGASNPFYGSMFTYDSRPTCNYTRGDNHCNADCAHAVNSCHYGGQTGAQGALAADFGNETNAEAIIAAALGCGAKDARCENSAGRDVGCAAGSGANHIHINAKSCDKN